MQCDNLKVACLLKTFTLEESLCKLQLNNLIMSVSQSVLSRHAMIVATSLLE